MVNLDYLFYHQILNYSSYRFLIKSNYSIKSDNLLIDSIFPLDLGKESIKSFYMIFIWL